MYSAEFLCWEVPSEKARNESIMGIQMDRKVKHKKGNLMGPWRSPDEERLRLICALIGDKIDAIRIREKVKKLSFGVKNTVNIFTELLAQRSHAGLFQVMRKLIAPYCGYSDLGIIKLDLWELV